MSPRRAVRAMAVATAGAALAACAPWQTPQPVQPSSYERSYEHVERKAGRLRRLAVLAIREAPPAACGTASDGEAELAEVDEAVRTLLVDRKGYELLAAEAQLDDATTTAVLHELVRLAPGAGGDQAPAATRALLDRLRAQAQVDGLLVLHRQDSCANAVAALRGMLAVGTLGLSELIPNPDLQKIDSLCFLSILESASGRLVWHRAVDRPQLALERFAVDDDPPSAGRCAFRRYLEPLEPAVPKLLTR
jgi:hypothetical protein